MYALPAIGILLAIAVVLSAYPTKHSRIGNAVGLDTPASAVALLRAMREAGYDLGDGFPEGHPYAKLVAAPLVDELPEMFVLGSSPYGPQFAAVNGMNAVFAHHMSPELAFEALREYRRNFAPGPLGAQPYSAMSVLAFASHDEDAVTEFEAAWTLTIANIRRGIREPLRPEQVREYASSPQFKAGQQDDGRMVTGEPKAVAERLLEMRELAEVDEIVVVTPSLDRDRRLGSYTALADAWRRAT